LLRKLTLGIIKIVEEKKVFYYMESRKIIRTISEKYNLQAIGLFESRSSGNFREDSDYDFL
jgi:predicted nucleotidyltransferase